MKWKIKKIKRAQFSLKRPSANDNGVHKTDFS